MPPPKSFSEGKKKAWVSWRGIRARCLNKNTPAWQLYGKVGITACDAWRDNFLQFYQDMGDPPTKTHSIERIKNSDGYNPTNCKWATRSEQAVNRKTTHFVTFNGETLPLKHWAKKIGIKYKTLWMRINNYGWTIEKSFALPLVLCGFTTLPKKSPMCTYPGCSTKRRGKDYCKRHRTIVKNTQLLSNELIEEEV